MNLLPDYIVDEGEAIRKLKSEILVRISRHSALIKRYLKFKDKNKKIYLLASINNTYAPCCVSGSIGKKIISIIIKGENTRKQIPIENIIKIISEESYNNLL